MTHEGWKTYKRPHEFITACLFDGTIQSAMNIINALNKSFEIRGMTIAAGQFRVGYCKSNSTEVVTLTLEPGMLACVDAHGHVFVEKEEYFNIYYKEVVKTPPMSDDDASDGFID